MFSIKEAVRYGWGKFRANLEISLLTSLFVLALEAVNQFNHRSIILSIAIIVGAMIIRIGYVKIFLRINDGESPKFVEIFHEYRLFWKYIGMCILYGLAILGGLILLIIPGIYWGIRFSFAPFILVDTKAGPVKSLKESYALTKGKFGKIFLFWLVIGGLNILGFIALGVGVLVSLPVTTFASIYVYRELSKSLAPLTPVSTSI